MSILRLTPEQFAAYKKAAAKAFPQKRVSQAKAAAGHIGGHARAAALAPQRRREIAQIAADVRWNGKREPPIAGEANAQDRPSQKAQQGPKTGSGRD